MEPKHFEVPLGDIKIRGTFVVTPPKPKPAETPEGEEKPPEE